MAVFQTCPSGHFHHTSLWLPGVTISGVRVPFSVSSHWAAISGCSIARSLKPAKTRRPAQYGQPEFSTTLAAMTACHSWQRMRMSILVLCLNASVNYLAYCETIMDKPAHLTRLIVFYITKVVQHLKKRTSRYYFCEISQKICWNTLRFRSFYIILKLI